MDYTYSKFLNNKNDRSTNRSFFNKILLLIVLVLSLMILFKSNPDFKNKVYKFVYEDNISFSMFKEFFNNYLGGSIPFDSNIDKDVVSVFNENISYKEKSDYNNGVKLVVDDNYLVPVIESGIVVYKGEKDNYGYTVIIQQVDGVDAWYSNISSDIELYDYVEKGSLLGEVKDNNLYLYFYKNGDFIDYKEYL